ncbi:MAG: hypothetical protein CVU39_14430 [Chloroflexi bacterium HGW-Chloroflexi-10]|nr:MAG: hypothetical protein CVU39_14430 [Chloroflexi bacterium HGW-Chloroflexi-10]
MKIIAINGSHRGSRGLTSHLISLIFQGAQQSGATCEEIVLSKLKINRCLGCSQCHRDASLLQCVYDSKDDVRMVFDKMATADLIIYATPVYVFGMTGLMKTFLDRINATGDSREFRCTQSGLFFHHITPEICSKPFVSLVCCDNIENDTTANAVHYFRTYARFMDAPLVGQLVRNGGKFIKHGLDAAANHQNPKIEKIYAAFIQAGFELATKEKISRSTQRSTNQEVLPVPFLSLLKRIKSRRVKQVFVEKAKEFSIAKH